MALRSCFSSALSRSICSSSSIFRSTIMPVRSDGVPDPRGIPVRSGPGGEAIVISMRSRRSSWLSMSLSMAV